MRTRGLAIVVLVAGLAEAQPIDTALVVLERDGQHSARSLRSWVELTEALRRTESRLRVRGPEEQAEGGLSPRLEAEVSGRAALAAVERLRQSGDRDGAARSAAEALKALERADWRTTQRAFVEALAWKGALQGGQAELSFLFTLEPSFAFPAGGVPDDTQQQVDLQRQGKAKAARSTFVIDSPVPALVWVDGVLVGMTPATTASLVAGRHRLTAFTPGAPLLQSIELLTPGTTVQLPFAPSDDAAALRAMWAELVAGVRRDQPRPLAALEERTSTSELLLVALEGDGAEVLRLTRSETSRERVRPVSTEALTAAVRRLYDHSSTSSEPPAVVTPAKGRRPFPLLLSAAGAALGAVGLGVFVASRGDLAAAQRVPQANEAEYAQAISRARLSSYTSYGLLGVGAATALAGLGWWWLQPESPQVVLVPRLDGLALAGTW